MDTNVTFLVCHFLYRSLSAGMQQPQSVTIAVNMLLRTLSFRIIMSNKISSILIYIPLKMPPNVFLCVNVYLF